MRTLILMFWLRVGRVLKMLARLEGYNQRQRIMYVSQLVMCGSLLRGITLIRLRKVPLNDR